MLVTVIAAYRTLTQNLTQSCYPPAGGVLWWHTAAWPTGPATSSSTGRRRCGRPSSARWTPRLMATGAAPTATSLWSPAPPHRRTRMSCWPPPRHLRKTKTKIRNSMLSLKKLKHTKVTKGRGVKWYEWIHVKWVWMADDVNGFLMLMIFLSGK